MPNELWAIVPALDLVDLTLDTCRDLLAQSIPTRVLLIDQGSSEASNDAFRVFADAHHPQVLLWTFNPPLPSLSAAWNRALQYVWDLGAPDALVCNNDIRLRPDTAADLRRVRAATGAYFLTGIWVTAEQFAASTGYTGDGTGDRGGPCFSCFLITKEGHQAYPFDEGFIPCYGEDLDTHRRYLLNSDGDRICSINLPFHHIGGGSRTINQSEAARTTFERQVQIGRAYYRQKWGGGPNQERFIRPFGPQGYDGVTLPELQARWQRGEALLPPLAQLDAAMHGATVTLYDDPAEPDHELTESEEIAAVERAFAAKLQGLSDRGAL